MEPWQKLMQALCEIWVEEDIKAGKFNDEEKLEQDNRSENTERSEELDESA